MTSKLMLTEHFDDVLRDIVENHFFFRHSSTLSLEYLLNRLSHADTLNFTESFYAMAHIVASVNEAVNRLLFRREQKILEEFVALFIYRFHDQLSKRPISTEEIAGFAGALLLLDTIPLKYTRKLLNMGGTGGDKGLTHNGENYTLNFNPSTCTMIAIAASGVPIHKHHSVAYTSKIGGVEAFSALGVPRAQNDPSIVLRALNRFHLAATDFLVYHMSPRIMRQLRQQNTELFSFMHIVGPLASPAYLSDTVHFLGLSHEYALQTVADALSILSEHNIIKNPRGVLFRGLDDNGDAAFDEISPFSTELLLFNEGASKRVLLRTAEIIGQPIIPNSTDFLNLFTCRKDKSLAKQFNNNYRIINDPTFASPAKNIVILSAALAKQVYRHNYDPETFNERDFVNRLKREYISTDQAFRAGEVARYWSDYLQLYAGLAI